MKIQQLLCLIII